MTTLQSGSELPVEINILIAAAVRIESATPQTDRCLHRRLQTVCSLSSSVVESRASTRLRGPSDPKALATVRLKNRMQLQRSPSPL